MEIVGVDELERQRVALQGRLDERKTKIERNRLGQFATPPALALELLRHAKSLLSRETGVRFVDPAIGTGAFFSALLTTFPKSRIQEALGFEVDPHYGVPAARLWKETDLSIRVTDFTREIGESRFNLLICNPPYVRHHHIRGDEKSRLQSRTMKTCATRIGGLAGLYCYFIGLSHAWLAKDGISGWLVPSEFMDVNYGRALKSYLLDRVTLLQIHRFDPSDVQFSDALVSSAVVWFRNSPPPADHAVKFSFGGSLSRPTISRTIQAEALAHEPKWTRFPVSEVRGRPSGPTLADFFRVKRGVATGDNSYFILTAEEIEARRLPIECFTPILPSPRYVLVDEIGADASGNPLLERRLFLLDTKLSEAEIKERHPALLAYLTEGKKKGLHERYLCGHRTPWYGQENRPPAPIVCTYLGRSGTTSGRPFRFILNRSQATVANVYLALYPTPTLARAIAGDPTLLRRVWQRLNGIPPERLLGEGRVYGGGLHKLEPRELANLPTPEISELLPHAEKPLKQSELFAS